MSRFFKSAAFPILIVILLAFVAQKLVVSNSGSSQKLGFSDVLTKIDQGQVSQAKIKRQGPGASASPWPTARR